MKFDIEWLQKDEPEQRTDLFYCEGYQHSPVCIITGGSRKVLISCDGEMRIKYKYGGETFTLTDYWDLLEHDIKRDIDLNKLDYDNYIDNPWFAAYDITNNYDEDAGWETYEDIGFVHDNLDEMILRVKYYITEGKYND